MRFIWCCISLARQVSSSLTLSLWLWGNSRIPFYSPNLDMYDIYYSIYSPIILCILVEQRFGSQERDNSLKRVSSLPPISYPREESQMPVSRSSNNVTRRWNSSSGPDYRCNLTEGLNAIKWILSVFPWY